MSVGVFAGANHDCAMQALRSVTGLTLGLALTSCDPLFSTQYRQVLAPAPARGCVANAIAGTPLIVVAVADTADRERKVLDRYRVVVRDTLIRTGHWDAWLDVFTPTNDSGAVAMTYSYPGFAQPTDAERLRWQQQSKTVLEAVRARCAPTSRAEVTCRSIGGNRRACRV